MIHYLDEDFQEAYLKWVESRFLIDGMDEIPDSCYEPRVQAWCAYTDVRDGLKRGTSYGRYLREQQLGHRDFINEQ